MFPATQHLSALSASNQTDCQAMVSPDSEATHCGSFIPKKTITLSAALTTICWANTPHILGSRSYCPAVIPQMNSGSHQAHYKV